VNRDSGTASANGGWLRRLVRQLGHLSLLFRKLQKCSPNKPPATMLTNKLNTDKRTPEKTGGESFFQISHKEPT
jgi:hypothetical protein